MKEDLFKLCSFCSGLDLQRLPAAVIEQAKQVVLDTLGVIVSGSRAAEVERLYAKLAAESTEDAGVTCPGRSRRLPVLSAVLVNGMAGSNQEWEEGHSRAMGHPAVQLVPALVAEGERTGASGARLLTSLVAGYEAACRISRAASIRKGLHPTGTWGVAGAAIAVGVLRGRKPESLAAIADIAASYAFSPYVKNSFVGRNVASTFAAMVNFAGVLANDFFDCGIQADPACLEMTFARFVSESFNPSALSGGLGASFAITENYFKPYPACRFTHPALEALRALLKDHPLHAAEIDRIRIESFKAAVHGGGGRPANVEAMRFSIPHLAAVLILQGKAGIEALSDAQLEDPQVGELAGRVDLELAPAYEAMRPLQSPARVEALLKDGRRISREILDCLGDPANPLPAEEVRAKFRKLAGPVLGSAPAEEFIARVGDLEREPDLRSLTTLLRPEV